MPDKQESRDKNGAALTCRQFIHGASAAAVGMLGLQEQKVARFDPIKEEILL